MKKVNILGVNISVLPRQKVINRIREFLDDDEGQHYVVTPNPEIILRAGHDEEFFYILNRADLAVADGVGLKIAGWFLGRNIPRITGADLVRDVLDLAEKKSLRVGIINPPDGLSSAKDIKKTLKGIHPDLTIEVFEAEREDVPTLKNKRVAEFRPQVLLATLGAPYQEKLIYHNLNSLPSVRLAMGVGGAIDFLTGKIRRAPKFLRVSGLEWLWRLYNQPRRIKRIFNAVVVFFVNFLNWKFILPWKYRSNVACLLYKKEDNSYKVLVVERQEMPGQWQLPQGGIEKNEDLKTAGSRELREEINCDSFRPVAQFPKLLRYKFPPGKKEVLKHLGYKGQKQGLFIAEFTGRDSDIRVNFWEHRNWKWVDQKKLISSVQPVRREAVRKMLNKFQKEIINKDS